MVRSRLATALGPCFFAVVALLLMGCPPRDRTRGAGPAAVVPQLSTSEIREAYNNRVAAVERLRAQAVVEVGWVDDKDKSHWEQGDGPLIIRNPHDLALAIGKLGNVMFWLGRNADRYWFFELNPPDNQPPVAYVGQIDELDQLRPNQLPLPIRPDQLIDFLGITILPDDFEVIRATTADNPGIYLLRERESAAPSRRYWWLDEQFRPTRIGFIGPSGEVLAEAALSAYKPLPLAGSPPGAWPDVATRIEIKLPANRANVLLNLSDLTTDESKFSDAQFDFDRLVRAHKPQQVRVIEPGM